LFSYFGRRGFDCRPVGIPSLLIFVITSARCFEYTLGMDHFGILSSPSQFVDHNLLAMRVAFSFLKVT